MADNTDLLNQFRQIVQEEVAPVKQTQQEQGKKLDEHSKQFAEQGKKLDTLTEKVTGLDVKVDRLEDGQNRQLTMTKILQGAIEETRLVVDKLLHRPRQAD